MLKDTRNDFIHSGFMPGPREREMLVAEVLQLDIDVTHGQQGCKTEPRP
jgi:hypothetical protein